MSNGYVERYGLRIPPIVDSQSRPVATQPDWLIERNICLNYAKLEAKFPGKLLPRHEHFKKFCNHIWGDETKRFYFEFNPNACRILEAHEKHRYLAVAGHASSSKTETMALIGVAEFLIDPENTKVLVTSTDAKSAKGKVWGSIENCWNEAVNFYEEWEAKFQSIGVKGACFIPGKLISSESIIRMWDGKVVNPKRGIELIAAEISKAKEASDKLQGYKADKLLLMADELATITPAVLETATSNFRMNDKFRMIGAFNPDSFYDPGGVMSKPVDGWSSINEHSEEWETVIEPQGINGYCIRFDGEKSPNVLAGRKIWRGLLDMDQLNSFRASLGGEKSKSYWKMVRGYWSPTGSMEAIYSEADIINYHADSPVTTWLMQPTFIAGLDPSYTHGGDKAALVIGKVGRCRNIATGQDHIVFERVETVILDNDITDQSIDKSEWVVRLTKQKMDEYGIKVTDLAVDTSGAGAFSSLLRRDIGTGFMDVVFNASATEERYSSSDKRTGKERFNDLMSEIWYVGKELIRSGQLKGLDPDTVTEMCARTYDEKNGKVVVEPKDKMKKRTKKSPDRADSLFVTIHLARMRHSLKSTEKAAPRHQVPHTPILNRRDLVLSQPMQPRRATLHDLAENVGNWAGAGWGEQGW
jgi:hypothetical protein